ncbi:hypothetical protein MADA3029_60120 [Vibrio nigripulchritudo MADA3029]|nr:hypothetical protein MADA3029_60120 [Vibrio nigripulchritudo MADA3029]
MIFLVVSTDMVITQSTKNTVYKVSIIKLMLFSQYKDELSVRSADSSCQ